MIKEKYDSTLIDIFVPGKGKNDFLEKVNKIVDFKRISRMLNIKYRKHKGTIGAPGYSGILLFKILLLEMWYDLSDLKVEIEIMDRISFIKFLGLSMSSPVPDHSVISRYRKFLIENKLYDKLFLEISRQLEKQGFLVKKGIIADATVIQSHNRPKTKTLEYVTKDRNETEEKSEIKITYSKDEDANWIFKQGRYHYGFKVHTLVNQDGYILGGHITSASKSDTRELPQLLKDIEIKAGNPFYADKGYASKENRNMLKQHNLLDRIMIKKPKNKKINQYKKNKNKAISKVRFVVEQTFGLLKSGFGFNKMRYTGIIKSEFEFKMKGMAFNIKKAIFSVS